MVCSKTFPEDDTSSGSNCFRTMIFLPEYPFRKSSPKIQFSFLKICFSSTAFRFLRNPRKSSSMAFQFLQRLSNFFNAFLLTNYSYLEQFVPLTSCHSSHSLASVKDMYVEMGFQLNLYRQEEPHCFHSFKKNVDGWLGNAKGSD